MHLVVLIQPVLALFMLPSKHATCPVGFEDAVAWLQVNWVMCESGCPYRCAVKFSLCPSFHVSKLRHTHAYCSYISRFTVAGGVFSLWIYAVPVSATCTRLIVNAGGNFPLPPAPKLSLADPSALLQRLNPRPLAQKLIKRFRWGSIV